MLVGGAQGVVELPVHFKLPVGVFVVVLVRAPTQLKHIITDLGDHVVAPHDGLLVITGLFSRVVGVGNLRAFGGKQEELGFNAGFHVHALSFGFTDQSVEDVTRTLINQFVFHHEVGSNPRHFRLPWQLDDG